MRQLLIAGAGLMVCGLFALAGQVADRPVVYTAAQAKAGRKALQTNSFGACTDCHTRSLGGRSGAAGEVPPLSSLPVDSQKLISGGGGYVPDLVGSKFRTRWAGRSTKDLTMEFQGRFGNLSSETRTALIAYILQANGARAGKQPLTAETDVKIGTLIPSGAAK